MRLLLVLATVLLVAACDTAPAGADALVGEWTAVGRRSATLAESRVDQHVPDFGAEGPGDLAVAGGAGLPLAVVEGVGPSVATVRAGTAGGAVLTLRESARFPSEARLMLGDSVYAARLAVGADLFTFADGRLTVPEVTVVGEGGARRQFRVGGARAVPMRTLRAGQEVVFETGTSPLVPDLGAYTLWLKADGTARRREIVSQGSPAPTFGRWEASGTDALTLTFDGEPIRYQYRFEDGALVLERPGAVVVEAEALRAFEARLFAEPGSIAKLRYVSGDVLQAGEAMALGGI